MDSETLISLDTLSKLLMLSSMRVRQLVEAKWIPKTGTQYPLSGAVQGYIKFLKDSERRTSKSAGAARVQEARAAGLERENSVVAGLLMDTAESLADFA